MNTYRLQFSKKAIAALCVAGLVVCLAQSCAVEQPESQDPGTEQVTTLALQHETAGANVGDQIEVAVQVENVTDLYGVALDIVYDPAVYKYVSSARGDFLASDGREINFAAALEDGFQGRLVIGVSRIGDVEGLEGTGPVMTASFELLCEDCVEKELKLDKAYLKNPDLEDISFEQIAGGEQ